MLYKKQFMVLYANYFLPYYLKYFSKMNNLFNSVVQKVFWLFM